MKIAHIRVDENQAVSFEERARIALVGKLVSVATKQFRSLDVAWHQLPKAKQEAALEEIRALPGKRDGYAQVARDMIALSIKIDRFNRRKAWN